MRTSILVLVTWASAFCIAWSRLDYHQYNKGSRTGILQVVAFMHLRIHITCVITRSVPLFIDDEHVGGVEGGSLLGCNSPNWIV